MQEIFSFFFPSIFSIPLPYIIDKFDGPIDTSISIKAYRYVGTEWNRYGPIDTFYRHGCIDTKISRWVGRLVYYLERLFPYQKFYKAPFYLPFYIILNFPREAPIYPPPMSAHDSHTISPIGVGREVWF